MTSSDSEQYIASRVYFHLRYSKSIALFQDLKEYLMLQSCRRKNRNRKLTTG